MSPDDVHTEEMPTLYDDPWPADDQALAALAEDLRIVASGPAPEPRPGLVAVMAQGTVRPSGPQTGRRKMLAKTALGSLAAKVALGVGVAAASMTAVGATGVLPDAAQHALASVVSATTPFVLPDPSAAVTAEAGDDTPGSTTTTSSTMPTPTTILGGGTGTPTTLVGGTDADGADDHVADNHGACVSAIAQDKSGTDNHGKVVSTVARSDCGKTTATSTPSSSSTTTSTTVGIAPNKSSSGPGNSGNNGNGNGNGNGGSSKSGKG